MGKSRTARAAVHRLVLWAGDLSTAGALSDLLEIPGASLQIFKNYPQIPRTNHDFKLDAPLPVLKLPLPSKLMVRRIELDWYPRIEAYAVGSADVAQEVAKQTQQFHSHQLALVDWDAVFFELEAFKRVRGFENLLIQREDLPKLFADGHGGWYTLYAPDCVFR